jgi:hypothetical protein
LARPSQPGSSHNRKKCLTRLPRRRGRAMTAGWSVPANERSSD